ncbi:MAG: alpha/beta hydrolase [Pyrinomonadaceae bacterium]|nr:alpha/beta hydrolase [Pyrinomonadaceae bacterium]MBP6212790.1 alpha/beta hydrolase [Pyrinomonadaceae bacterium]
MLRRLGKIVGLISIVAIAAFTIFWFSRPADISFDQYRPVVPFAEFSRFAVVDGVKVHYQEKGTGTPLVLIHGYASSTFTWKDMIEPLSRKYRVIAIDLKGFGFTDKPDGDYSRRAQAMIVGHLLEQLNIEKAWICGNSMGGETAINLALQFPNRVAGLVLIDAAGLNVPGTATLVPAYLRNPLLNRALSAIALTSDKLVREGLIKSYFDDTKIGDDRVAAYYRPLTSRGGQLAALRARTQFGEFPIEAELGEIDVPTLLIWGRQDELIPVEAGTRMNSAIKNSKLEIIEECGHVPQEERPEVVVGMINAFIPQS